MSRIDDENERELLQEMLDSPGWLILANRVLPKLLASSTTEIFKATRKNESASYYIGKYDGFLDLIEKTYNAADVHLPERLKELRRQT